MMFSQVIFAIDDGHELRSRKLFLRYMDNMIAMGVVKYCTQCIGFWKGQMETCYMMRETDFRECVLDSSWVGLQQCFMVVPGDTRQPCTLLYSNGLVESMGGPLVEVDYKEAMASEGWTFVEETQTFWVVK